MTRYTLTDWYSASTPELEAPSRVIRGTEPISLPECIELMVKEGWRIREADDNACYLERGHVTLYLMEV